MKSIAVCPRGTQFWTFYFNFFVSARFDSKRLCAYGDDDDGGGGDAMQTHQTTNFPKRNNNNIHCGCDALRSAANERDESRSILAFRMWAHIILLSLEFCTPSNLLSFGCRLYCRCCEHVLSVNVFRRIFLQFISNSKIAESRCAHATRLAIHCRWCRVTFCFSSTVWWIWPASQPAGHKSNGVSHQKMNQRTVRHAEDLNKSCTKVNPGNHTTVAVGHKSNFFLLHF